MTQTLIWQTHSTCTMGFNTQSSNALRRDVCSSLGAQLDAFNVDVYGGPTPASPTQISVASNTDVKYNSSTGLWAVEAYVTWSLQRDNLHYHSIQVRHINPIGRLPNDHSKRDIRHIQRELRSVRWWQHVHCERPCRFLQHNPHLRVEDGRHRIIQADPRVGS